MLPLFSLVGISPQFAQVVVIVESVDHLSDESPMEGPPIPITIDMDKKVISQMKAGKAPGPSDIVVEMIRAAGDASASIIRVPSDWEQSFIVCLYKGKGTALEREITAASS